jgi:hypothetical protein
MAAIITENFRQHNAEQFHESFSEASPSQYYMFIGKSTPFTSSTSGGTDTAPPSPADMVTNDYYYWDAMTGANAIAASDVSFTIPRRNWANATTFDMYEHDVSASNTATSGATNLYNSTFYFVTSDYRVYKVLDNNGGTAYSGAEPTSTSPTPFFLGGYYLQYMYSLTVSEIDKFLTTDFLHVSTDSTVSAAAVNGSVDVVRITAGAGYTDGTYYSPIDGDGTGGIVKIHVSANAIASFGSGGSATEVFAAGSGYTFGSVDLTNVYSDSGLTTATTMGAGTNGVVDPIISPPGGHGKDAVRELGGHYVMMNIKLEQAEGDDLTTENEFRHLGIVKDPYNFGTTTVATASTIRQTYAVKLAFAPSQPYDADEKITQSTTGAVGRVVEFDATRNIIYYTQERYANYGIDSEGNQTAFSGANVITGADSTATGTPQSTASEVVSLAGGSTITFNTGYANPELEPDSGKMLYVENRRPIARASDQTEDIKVIVEF